MSAAKTSLANQKTVTTEDSLRYLEDALTNLEAEVDLDSITADSFAAWVTEHDRDLASIVAALNPTESAYARVLEQRKRQ